MGKGRQQPRSYQELCSISGTSGTRHPAAPNTHPDRDQPSENQTPGPISPETLGQWGQGPAELITEPALPRYLIWRVAVPVEELLPQPAVDDSAGAEIFRWRVIFTQFFVERLVLPGPRLIAIAAQQVLEAFQGENDVTALSCATGGTKPLPQRSKLVEDPVSCYRPSAYSPPAEQPAIGAGRHEVVKDAANAPDRQRHIDQAGQRQSRAGRSLRGCWRLLLLD